MYAAHGLFKEVSHPFYADSIILDFWTWDVISVTIMGLFVVLLNFPAIMRCCNVGAKSARLWKYADCRPINFNGFCWTHLRDRTCGSLSGEWSHSDLCPISFCCRLARTSLVGFFLEAAYAIIWGTAEPLMWPVIRYSWHLFTVTSMKKLVKVTTRARAGTTQVILCLTFGSFLVA